MRWPVTPAPQASYIKKASGWRALLCVRGRREERSFRTRAEATAWAERRAAELRAEAGGQAGQHKTLADAFARYASEVAPTHRGCTGEIKRLAVFAKDAALPTHKPLATLTARDIGATVGQPGRLTFPEFCRVFGWRDPAHALIYVNTSAADLAARL